MDTPPSRFNFKQFSGKKIVHDNRLATPPLGLCPRIGNPGSATATTVESDGVILALFFHFALPGYVKATMIPLTPAFGKNW